jgi:hypothetical protein
MSVSASASARIALPPRQKENAGGFPPASRFSSAESRFYGRVSSSLIVVEATLARLVIALAALRASVATTLRTTCFGRRLEATGSSTGTRSARGAREVGAPIAHRAAIAGRSATVTTATAATAAVAAATAITTATAAAAIATAAAVAAATTTTTTATIATAAAIGRTRTARPEAAAVAAATTTPAAKSAATTTTTGLTFDGFTDGDRAAVEESSVHGLHRCSALVVGFHLEEGEAAAAAGLAIHDHF